MGGDCHSFNDHLNYYLLPNLETLSPTSLTVTVGWSGEAKMIHGDLQTGEITKFETLDPMGVPLPYPTSMLIQAKVSII